MNKIQADELYDDYSPLLKWWLMNYMDLLYKPPGAYLQIRKMHQHVVLDIPWKDFKDGCGVDFMAMGYMNNKNKMTQLKRNYMNVEALEKCNEQFRERLAGKGGKSKQTCVSAVLGNREKDKRSKGFCMQTVTINYLADGRFSLDLHYRTTEFGQKFLADLRFLAEEVFPILLSGVAWQPDMVKFFFSSVYISTQFMPVFYQFIPEQIIQHMECLKEGDPAFYRRSLLALGHLLHEETNYNYVSHRNQHWLMWSHVEPYISVSYWKQLEKYCRDNT